MPEADRSVRWAVYRHFAHQGLAPSVADLAAATGLGPAEVSAALTRLGDRHALALQPGTDQLWMAHPFSAVPTDYPVTSGGPRYWANCAWDVLGISVAIDHDVRSVGPCPGSGQELVLEVRHAECVPNPGVVHFAVPPRHFWDDIGFT